MRHAGGGRGAAGTRRLRRVVSFTAALALPVLAAVEIAGEVAVAARAQGDPEWDAVAREVRAMARPGDLVVVAPRWAEPHLRQRLGDDVMPLAHLARPDASRFASAIEVGLRGASAPDLAGREVEDERAVGAFVLRRLAARDPDPVRVDLVDLLRPPHGAVLVTDPPASCIWSTRSPVLAGGLGGHPTLPRERFECPGPPWMAVGVTVIADQRFLPRRCLWAHPPGHGDRVLRWSDVPLAGARRLVGHHGMYWVIERDGVGADVEIEIRVDGQAIGTTVHRDGDGWSPFTFDLPGAAPDRAATIEIAVRTSDADRRHLCLEATLR